jgi:hypothetical protein
MLKSMFHVLPIPMNLRGNAKETDCVKDINKEDNSWFIVNDLFIVYIGLYYYTDTYSYQL